MFKFACGVLVGLLVACFCYVKTANVYNTTRAVYIGQVMVLDKETLAVKYLNLGALKFTF